jgi:hypothetical protein
LKLIIFKPVLDRKIKTIIMMKRTYFLLPLMLLALLFTSCEKEDSSDVNQDKIYTVYELFYNKNTDKTVAICRLRFGGPTGTLLEATGAAGVTYNGDNLPYSAIYSGHAKEYAGKLSGGSFTYTNINGTSFTNTVPSMDTIAFDPSFDTIVKSQANTFTWVGNPVAINERVNLYIGTWTWGQDAAFFAITPGQTNIIMGINQMNSLAVGGSTGHMDRINEIPVTNGTPEGGVVRTRFTAPTQQIQVIP